MNFQISSEKIGNPLLVDLLRKVCRCFGEIEQDFFVIGATARDILIRQLVGISSGRKTRDLDVAIAIPHWDALLLCSDGYYQGQNIYHCFPPNRLPAPSRIEDDSSVVRIEVF